MIDIIMLKINTEKKDLLRMASKGKFELTTEAKGE
jgi:hypothetical protein